MSANPERYRFHGGLHLDDHKQESLTRPLQQATLPEEIILRLNQHIGEANSPEVSVGDRVKKGQLLATSNEFVSASIHAPTSGVITAIELRPIAHASGQEAECIVLTPDDQDEMVELTPPAQRSDVETLLQAIHQAGIVGLGGAVFPTAAKLRTALKHDIETLIINGAECEPYITCDDLLMQTDAERICRGIAHLQAIVHPGNTLIGIEDNKPKAIAAMQQAIKETGVNARVVSIPTLYPSGGEKQLVKILTGKEVQSGQLAFETGMFCQNVGTCAAISDALDFGMPLISRIVTVTGPGIREPGNWLVPLGTPMHHLAELAGGYTVDNPKLIMGGPMMGLPLQNDQVPVVKATNTLLVLNQDDQPAARPCVRCGSCAEVCPAQLLPQQLYWYSRSRQFEQAESFNLFDCIECGCCAAVCPSHLPLVQFYRYAKSEIWEQRRKTYKADRSRKRHEFREARIQRQKEADEERRRQKREALARKKAAEAAAAEDKPANQAKSSTDAVQAAMERVKARKEKQNVQPKNTSDLSPEQQRQIEEADTRRNKQQDQEPS